MVVVAVVETTAPASLVTVGAMKASVPPCPMIVAPAWISTVDVEVEVPKVNWLAGDSAPATKVASAVVIGEVVARRPPVFTTAPLPKITPPGA